MNSLTKNDLHFVVSRMPKDVQELIKDNNLFLGGGFIRSTIGREKVSDIDLFGPTVESIEKAAYKISSKRKARFHETDNAFTVLSPPRYPIQLIKRWLYDSPDELIQSFDFTVCQAAIFFKEGKWESLISEAFYPDLAGKRLVYTAPNRVEAPGGSMMRVLKYLRRDYCVQANSLSSIIARLISGVKNIEDKTEIENATIICSLLREVDPLLVVDGVDLVDDLESETAD